MEKLIVEEYIEDDYGRCCFCGWECNPHSQACGLCMRNHKYLENMIDDRLVSNNIPNR